MSELTTLNPVQQIEKLYQQYEREYIYNNNHNIEEPSKCPGPENREIDFSKDGSGVDSEKIKSFNAQINTILQDNYGSQVAFGYGFFEFCAQNSVYPLNFEVEIELLNNINDSCNIIEVIEKNKNIIEASKDNEGNNVYNYIYNKVKLLCDCGLCIKPGQFTIMKQHEVADKFFN